MRRAAALAAVAAAALAACGSGTGSAPHATTGTSTTTRPALVAPLTGLLDPDGAAQERPALSVKIENTPQARPQAGLGVADVVYEEVVEGGITRFWAVFGSAVPERVGPIRSVRRMDAAVVSPLGGVVAFSGGTPDNVALVRDAPVVTVDETNAGDAFFRDRDREAPHNLYGRPALLWRRGGRPVPPHAPFVFLALGETFAGEPVGGVTIGFEPGYAVTYRADPATGAWARSTEDTAFVDEAGAQIAPTNVLVQLVPYGSAGGDAELVGSGDALVLGAGRLARARWSKGGTAEPTVFTDAAGAPVRLLPGRTWVELVPTTVPVAVLPST